MRKALVFQALQGALHDSASDVDEIVAAEIAERDARIAELGAGRLHPEAPTAPELPQSYADPDGSSSAR